MGWGWRDTAILLAITAVAAGLRFYGLGTVPPGFQFDEAFNAMDAAHVLDGIRPLFLPANGGREPVYTYLQAGLASLLGLRIYTLRLTSALAGILTIPAVFVLLRVLMRRRSRSVAAFAALAVAISFWHLHFSHYGIRVILMPLIFSGVCGAFWLGWRLRSAWLYLLSGALAGLSVWAHPTGRLIPFVLLGFVLWLLWQHPSERGFAARRDEQPRGPSVLTGMLLACLAAFVVFLPLGVEFFRHPDFFLGHANEVSVFAQRVSGGSPLLALVRNALAVLGMFSLRGDLAWIHNLSGRPVFDALMSVAFWLGMYLWARRIVKQADPDRDALALLLCWLAVMLLPTVFSDDAPNFSRTLPAIPPLFLAVGLGLTAIMDAGTRRDAWGLVLRGDEARQAGRASRFVGPVIAAVVVLISLGMASRDYFVRFAQRPEVYYAYDVDKLDAWRQLQGMAQKGQVYLSQLWAEHATLEFLRRGSNVKSLDSSASLVLPPPGRDAAYALPAEQHGRALQLAGLWPGASMEQIADRYGKLLLDVVRVSAGQLAGWPATLRPDQAVDVPFAGGPAFLGMQERNGAITLFWGARTPMPRSLTAFVHLMDVDGRRVGQIDQLPGNGSYLTPVWTPGERVVERYSPDLEVCLDERPVRVLAGWYDLAADSARLRRGDGAGETVLAGEVVPPLISHKPKEARPPKEIGQALGDDLVLAGYGMEGRDLQAGSLLALDLYWQGAPEAAGRDLTITLRPAGGPEGASATPASLWQGSLLPARAQWRRGETICRRLTLHLPAEAPAGRYQLEAEVAGLTAILGEIILGPSTRQFQVPTIARPLAATLGDTVRLTGADVAPPAASGGPLKVSLVWQAAALIPVSYSVFVHLVDDAGQIAGQSDALPAGDRPTNQWLPGEVVVDVHNLTAPGGKYKLFAGMYDPITGLRLPASDAQGLPLPGNAVPLGEVTLP